MTHKWVSELTGIGSDNGLSPGRRQAIIWTNAGILSIGPLGTNFNDNFTEIHTFSLKKMRLKLSPRPQCVKSYFIFWNKTGRLPLRPILWRSRMMPGCLIGFLQVKEETNCLLPMSKGISEISFKAHQVVGGRATVFSETTLASV